MSASRVLAVLSSPLMSRRSHAAAILVCALTATLRPERAHGSTPLPLRLLPGASMFLRATPMPTATPAQPGRIVGAFPEPYAPCSSDSGDAQLSCLGTISRLPAQVPKGLLDLCEDRAGRDALAHVTCLETIAARTYSPKDIEICRTALPSQWKRCLLTHGADDEAAPLQTRLLTAFQVLDVLIDERSTETARSAVAHMIAQLEKPDATLSRTPAGERERMIDMCEEKSTHPDDDALCRTLINGNAFQKDPFDLCMGTAKSRFTPFTHRCLRGIANHAHTPLLFQICKAATGETPFKEPWAERCLALTGTTLLTAPVRAHVLEGLKVLRIALPKGQDAAREALAEVQARVRSAALPAPESTERLSERR